MGAEPYSYAPAELFRAGEQASRGWNVLYVEAGRERSIAERAYPLGFDIYFPEGARTRAARGQTVVARRPVWGSYVVASSREGRSIEHILPRDSGHELQEFEQAGERRTTLVSSSGGVDGVIDVLRHPVSRIPYLLAEAVILDCWRRQKAGDFDEIVEHRPGRAAPRWVKVGHTARIVGGIAAQLGLSTGIIADLSRIPEIGLDVRIFGRITRVWSPLEFLAKGI